MIFSTSARTFYVWVFSLIFGAFLVGPVRPAFAEEFTVHLEAIGPERPTPFPKQLRVVVTNESFTSLALLQKMNASELVIDHRPFKRLETAFRGPVGLPAKGSWEGCLAAADYVPQAITPGSHRLQWRLGKALSEEIRAKWPKPAPPATSPKERLRQVEALRDTLVPGLLRSCVENWLTEKDGGLASSDAVRYYVDPGVKVLVPYDQSVPEPRVKGPIQIYLESQVAD